MFQVTLTPAGGGAPQHMYGHYETPYGTYGPAVAVEAERDVDTFGSNFFQPLTLTLSPLARGEGAQERRRYQIFTRSSGFT